MDDRSDDFLESHVDSFFPPEDSKEVIEEIDIGLATSGGEPTSFILGSIATTFGGASIYYAT